jgi:hypothetical protein
MAADSEDRPGLSTTTDLKKAENTIITLAGGLSSSLMLLRGEGSY